MQNIPLLRVKDLRKSYRNHLVLNDLSFNVDSNEIVGLIGHNGAGKSTAFYITIGLVRQDSGHIFFQGEEVSNIPVHKRALKGFGFLSQEPSVFETLTVNENIFCILETLNLTKKQRLEKLSESLEDLKISHLADKKGYMLSGGEKRRVEIARSLVTNPKLLLLDEPFANIDPITIQEVKSLIKLLKQKGISILITDHNARELFSIVDRSYLLTDGQILASGTPDELLNNPQARSSYLGESFEPLNA